MISNEIREKLQTVSSILNKHQVDYLVVGGVAVAFYGFQRASGIELVKPNLKTDLDFWYNPTIENFQNLFNALSELGVDEAVLKQIVFDPKKTFLKIPHKEFHTDFLCQMQGLESFRDARNRASIEVLDGNALPIISYNDLIKNKKAIDRAIDREDIKQLEKIRSKGPRLT